MQAVAPPNRYSAYPTNGQPCYFNASAGANNFINFYNPVDFALEGWLFNQSTKPDNSLNYFYNAPGSGGSEFFILNGGIGRTLSFPADSHELFSFVIEARCYALGAQASVGGAFDPDNEVLLDPDFSFGRFHKGHSAQFRSTNMKRASFWRAALQAWDLEP